jgi:hypothetical protein
VEILKDVAALISALAWPTIAVVAGAILLTKTNLLSFLNILYKGYSEKIEQSKSLPTPWGEIKIPDDVYADLVVKRKTISVETLEDTYSQSVDKNSLVQQYDSGKLILNVREYPSFIHEAALLKKDTYSVRLFLEFYDNAPSVANTPHRNKFSKDSVAAVHYLLHESFRQRVITSTSREKGFEAWLSIWGEFTAIAVVEHKDGSTIAMTRSLNTPE